MSKIVDLSKAKVTAIKQLVAPKWVKMNLIEYVDPLGRQRDWEFCSRTTRQENSSCDAVGIVAIMHKSAGPELLLLKQFRPPLNGICVEVPAGLLDPNETIETCALRELNEETGFIGKVRRTPPLFYNDPGFTNTSTQMVHVDIDMSDPRNQKPVTHLEDSEFIETFTLPLKTLSAELQKLTEQGYFVDARVGNLADGIELASEFLK